MSVACTKKRGSVTKVLKAVPARNRQASTWSNLSNKEQNAKYQTMPPSWGEKLWKKIAVYCLLIAVPGTAFLLVGFVWQMHNALQNISEPELPFGTVVMQQNLPLTAISGAETDKKRKLILSQFTKKPRNQSYKAQNFGSDFEFLYKKIIYSSFTVLGISLCSVLLLLYFMARDKHNRYHYQSLLINKDNSMKNRFRYRTARLEAARYLAEKERQRAELLLQDTSHRVGNSLATVSSLLGVQLRHCQNDEVRRALLSARDRVQTISAAHRRLRLNTDMETASVGEFLTAVIQDVRNSLTAAQARQITIETHFEHWFLPARDVTTLGIILGELLTNAVKHAFPGKRPGKIYVAFGKLRSKNLRLIVEDNGIGLPLNRIHQNITTATAEQNQGLGQLILARLATQFNAKPHYTRSKTGGSRITIPLLNTKIEAKTEIKKPQQRKAAAFINCKIHA